MTSPAFFSTVSLVVIGILPAGAAAPPWDEILGPAQGSVPAAESGKVEWLTRTDAALRAAQADGRPIFVTFRCLPCKQCADFDKDVLEGGPALSPLLRQFHCVRITNAEHIDGRIFPYEGFQDLDLSWWAYFLSPKGRVYGIFGGKDEISENTRISVAALRNTMKRVLEHHCDPRRESWDIDGPAPDLAQPYPAPWDLPGWTNWEAGRTAEDGCLHCHELIEVVRQPAIDAGTFDPESDLQMWPLPENVGIALDRDHGLLVRTVARNSAAAEAGVEPGDILAAASGRRLFGQADFRGILHRGPAGDGTIDVIWRRGEKLMDGKLRVRDGWRKTVLDWRMSVSQGNIGAAPHFFPLPRSEARRRQLGIAEDAMAVEPFMGKNHTLARAAGLSPTDTIVAVDDESPNLAGREFLVWFRLSHQPGDRVTLTVADTDGRRRQVAYTLGEVHE